MINSSLNNRQLSKPISTDNKELFISIIKNYISNESYDTLCNELDNIKKKVEKITLLTLYSENNMVKKD